MLAASVACGTILSLAPGVASAAGGIECTSEMTGTIAANITVPVDKDCRLKNATVQGNVLVLNGGGLIVEGSTINGNLRGSGAQYWGLTDDDDNDRITVINGNVELVETTANPAVGTAEAMGAVPLSTATHNFACEATDFNSNVSIRNSLPTAPFLFGSAEGRQMTPATTVEECQEDNDERSGGNDVAGNYEALGNASDARHRDNSLHGHASLFGNTGTSDLLRNTVDRHLTCQGNTPPPDQEGNTENSPGSDGDQCPDATPTKPTAASKQRSAKRKRAKLRARARR